MSEVQSSSSSLSPKKSWAYLHKSTAWVSIPFISGIGAGIFSTLLCNPLDVAKVRLQVQGAVVTTKGPRKYRGTLGTLRTIVVEEGVLKGAFKGVG